jgi:curved DNA-binding protein CbpA
VQPGALKKSFRKAMLVVHPDKTAGKSLEVRLLAERLFSTLQEASKTAQWN